MKNQNKKGFTLVELVIVIAVIAILAGVLIGTFATVISRANQNKALQEWKARVDEAYVNYVADHHVTPKSVLVNTSTNAIEFGGFEDSDDGKMALILNTYVTLNETYSIYLNWSGENEYSVATSKVSDERAVTPVSVVKKYNEDLANAKNDITKMTSCLVGTEQYYIVTSYTATSTDSTDVSSYYTTTDDTNYTAATGTQVDGTKYYTLAKYNGQYTTGKWKYNGYTLTTSTGVWEKD